MNNVDVAELVGKRQDLIGLSDYVAAAVICAAKLIETLSTAHGEVSGIDPDYLQSLCEELYDSEQDLASRLG